MKPIPKELRAYFPKAPNRKRPWWNCNEIPMISRVGTQWLRPFDGRATDGSSMRKPAEIDADNPLPPPPILVGQVWALVYPGNCLRVGQVQAVQYDDEDVLVTLTLNTEDVPGCWLLQDGFLLSCPFGYAPWSGPEVL